MDVFRDEFVLHVEDMLSHDVRVDDAREAGSDPLDVSLHGSALPGTFKYYLGLSRRFRTVAGAPRVAVELRELMLCPAMSGDEGPRRGISRLVAFIGQRVMQTVVKRAVGADAVYYHREEAYDRDVEEE